jgi:hypothetical protein
MAIRNRRRGYIVSTRAKDDSAKPNRKRHMGNKHRKKARNKVKMRSHRRN